MHVVVVGGGTMGLASARVLARRGHRVSVLEQFGHIHDLGSHGGHTRIIRQAYHEGSGYVELVRAAERQWSELEDVLGEALLVRTGMIEFGPAADSGLNAAIQACRVAGVEHTVMDGRRARRRWPFLIPDDWTVCVSRAAGYLRTERCLEAMRRDADRHGATFRYDVRVAEIEDGPRPAVVLENGERIACDKVVVAAGAFTGKLLTGSWRSLVTPLRRVLLWVRPADEHRASLASLPVWGAFLPDGFVYGFPWCTEGIDGFKLAVHTMVDPEARRAFDRAIDPDRVDRDLHDEDVTPLLAFLERFCPAARGPVIGHRVCMYAATRTWDFIVDVHPQLAHVVLACGFSGHGFKFAPVVGEIVADLIEDRPPTARLPSFRIAAHRPPR